MVQAWRAFADLMPLLVLGVVVAVPAAIWRARQRVKRDGEAWSEALLVVGVRASAGLALLGVLGLTLEPLGVGMAPTTNWVPFATITDQLTSQIDASVAVRNVAFNVALFVPIGLTWTWVAILSARSWRMAVLAGTGLSVLVELTQMLLPVGRAADVDDVILNMLGVFVGVVAARAWESAAERFGKAADAA